MVFERCDMADILCHYHGRCVTQRHAFASKRKQSHTIVNDLHAHEPIIRFMSWWMLDLLLQAPHFMINHWRHCALHCLSKKREPRYCRGRVHEPTLQRTRKQKILRHFMYFNPWWKISDLAPVLISHLTHTGSAQNLVSVWRQSEMVNMNNLSGRLDFRL